MKRILIVDDDPVLLKLLKFGLDKAGYETLTADHGGEAMDIVHRENVDLVMVDLMMPVVDGLRFLRWLREEAKLSIPALVFSSYTTKTIAEDAINTGATAMINKPVKLPELLEKVDALLKR